MNEFSFNFRRWSCLVAFLVLLSLLVSCGRKSDTLSESNALLKLKLHWIPDTHQLGFWVALDKGMYKEQGLDLEIYPGGMGSNPIADVVSGSVDVGQVGGIEQVLLAKGEDLPVTAIAAIHRRTPHALISLSTRPIIDPSEFDGKKIAVAFGDTAEVLLKAYMHKKKIPDDLVTLVPFRFDLSPLLNGDVDGVTGFSTGQPVALEESGRHPAVLSYEDAGIRSYGYTLVASDKAITNKREALKAFLKASRLGWKYVFENPDESVSILAKRFDGSIDPNTARKELELIKHLMLDNRSQLSEWNFDPVVVSEVKALLVSYSDLDPSTITTDAFDNSLLEHE